MRKVFLILLIVTFFSCKKETKVEQTVKVEVKKEFIIEINYKTNKEGHFKISLNNLQVNDFQKKNIQFVEKVLVTTDINKIVANFGEDISNNVIINFGKDKPKNIELESIILNYGKNQQIVTTKNIHKHFKLNKFVIIDSINNALKTIKVGGAYNPNIFLNSSTLKALKKQK